MKRKVDFNETVVLGRDNCWWWTGNVHLDMKYFAAIRDGCINKLAFNGVLWVQDVYDRLGVLQTLDDIKRIRCFGWKFDDRYTYDKDEYISFTIGKEKCEYKVEINAYDLIGK